MAAIPAAGQEPDSNEGPTAVVETPKGSFTIRLLPDVAPRHVAHFIETAKAGGFDGTTFHRIIMGGIIQGGDPLSKDPDKASQYGTGGLDLYVCTDLFGFPGDADADGGWGTKSELCNGYPTQCSGIEDDLRIFGSSEEITLSIDADCASNGIADLKFTLSDDRLVVRDNRLGAGPPKNTNLGGQGVAWSAEPLIPSPPSPAASLRRRPVRDLATRVPSIPSPPALSGRPIRPDHAPRRNFQYFRDPPSRILRTRR